jgi:hypothetical protein
LKAAIAKSNAIPFGFYSMPSAVEYHNQHSTNVNMILPRLDKPANIEIHCRRDDRLPHSDGETFVSISLSKR